ncbi:MAG: DUF4252 domain-containing protein [Acidobacteria bacterium]|nr:DUF4252 domain-containing protein [Acidobacteriota bacterium]
MWSRLALASILIAATATPVDRGLDDFDGIVRHLESHFHKRRVWIPLMGLVNFVSHAARPLGASDFKLAVIEEVDARANPPDVTFAEHWRPLVRERDGEAVSIMGRPDGHKAVKLLMLVAENDNAVVMQMRMSPTRFLEFIAEKARESH